MDVSTDGRACCDNACQGETAEAVNRGCFCVSLDDRALRKALETELHSTTLFDLIAERCPHVFAAHPIFVSGFHARHIRQVVEAVESVVHLPDYRAAVLADAPAITGHDPHGAKGVFFGYDFHLHEAGVSLIEINTNAGGALLNAVLAKAQRACCAPVEKAWPRLDASEWEADIVAMFRNEWRLARGEKPLRAIAIVDEFPESQYLYPEFLLFRELFRRNGIDASIADPRELDLRDGTLMYGDTPIDLVYNRLTDFMLEDSPHAALREAYLRDNVVLTPHPQAHALYANKRNLALLSDRECLDALGVPATAQDILLSGIPRTVVVTPSDADRLWTERRKLFFKPMNGYGSKAAYRGDKLTRRAWDDILAGDYVAQSLAAPGERAVSPDQSLQPMKFDVRAYVYDGEVKWLAARIYQGQTTNFRTPGGGFAPVYVMD